MRKFSNEILTLGVSNCKSGNKVDVGDITSSWSIENQKSSDQIENHLL